MYPTPIAVAAVYLTCIGRLEPGPRGQGSEPIGPVRWGLVCSAVHYAGLAPEKLTRAFIDKLDTISNAEWNAKLSQAQVSQSGGGCEHVTTADARPSTPHPTPTRTRAGFYAQAATTKAAKAELSGRFDEAFKFNIEAAQTYLFLVRNTNSEATKAQLRAVSAKVLERAEKIKAAKKQHITPIGLSRLADG